MMGRFCEVSGRFERLRLAASRCSRHEVVQLLAEMVPGYRPGQPDRHVGGTGA